MELYNGFGFERITKNDVNELTAIMKRAFDEDSRRHLDEAEGARKRPDSRKEIIIFMSTNAGLKSCILGIRGTNTKKVILWKRKYKT
jgi:hypothetical protein